MKIFFLPALLCLCTIGCTYQEDFGSVDYSTTNRTTSKLSLKLYHNSDSTLLSADKFIAEFVNSACVVIAINGTDTVTYQNNQKAIVRSDQHKLRIQSNGFVFSDKTSAEITLKNNVLEAGLNPGNQTISSVFIVGDESDGF